jgi:hypothetical protein
MKKVFIISILFFVLSCKVTEKPELKKIESIKVIQANNKGIKVKADLLFLNKNSVGGTLQAKDVKVLIDSIAVANIETPPFNVPKKEAFTMPITVTIPYEKVFTDNKQNLLAGIMNMISNKKIQLSYVGEIRYQIGSFYYDYPLNYKQEVLIK